MVTMSRTMGMLCSASRSRVSSEAAIAGSAAFLAPLTATEPCRGLPPVMRNLSMPGFVEGAPEVVAGPPEQFPSLGGGHAALQNDQRHAHVVSGKPQSVSARGQA